MSSDPPEPRPPEVPDYEVLRRIGHGGYGEVWLVRSVTGIYRAAKVVWRDRFLDAAPYEREFRAVRLYAEISLEDPRLLRVLHVGRNDRAGYFYYVMELADPCVSAGSANEGKFNPDEYVPRTLRADLGSRGRLPTSEALPLGVDLTRALHSLHSRGRVHRDIKPSNVIFVGGLAKLADIGLVTDFREAATEVGTPGYLPPPPENPGSAKSDIFALGKVLYQLATGNTAPEFPKMPQEEIPVAERSQWLEFNEIILKAAERDPAVRYATAQDLLNDLLLVESGSSVRGWLRLRRQARWFKLAAMVLFVVAIASLAIAQAQRRITAKALERLDQSRYTAAQTRIAAGRHRDGRRFLEEIRADRKGPMPLEWRLLYGLAYGSPDRVYTGPAGEVSQIVSSDDGSRVAAIAVGGALWLWPPNATFGQTNSGSTLRLGPFPGTSMELIRLLETYRGQSNVIIDPPDSMSGFSLLSWVPGSPCLLVSQDPKRLDLEVRLVSDFSLKARLRIPPNAELPRTKLESVSVDGSTVAMVHYDPVGKRPAEVEIWNAGSETLRHRVPLRHEPHDLSIRGEGQQLAVANGTAAAPQFIDLISGQSLYLSDSVIQRGANVVAFSPDGRHLASGGTDGIIRLWGVTEGKMEESLVGHGPSVSSLAWSADGQFLFSGDTTGEIRRWRMTAGARAPTRLSGFWNKAFGDFCHGAQSSHWAATLADGHVGLWDSASQTTPRLVLTNAFEPVCFSDHDRVLWTYDDAGWVRSWSVQDGRMLTESGPVVPPGKTIGRIVVDPVRRVAFGLTYQDATLYRWNLAKHLLEATATNHFRNAYMLQYLPALDRVIVLRDNDGIYGWSGADLSTRFVIPGTPHINDANGLSCSPDGLRVAAGSHDGKVRVVDVARGHVERTFHAETSAILALAYSPDGSSIVVSHQSGLISWIDADTGRERVQFDPTTHQGQQLRAECFRIGFSGDGRILSALTNGGEETTEMVRWVVGHSPERSSNRTVTMRP